MKDYHIRSDCRLCGGKLHEQLDLGATTLANELPDRQDAEQELFPLYVSRCEDCSHVQLPVVVNPRRLFSDYVYRSNTSPVFVQHLKDFARDVQPKPGGFVVEIGSNDGSLLAEYKRNGFEVLGVDPAKNIADIAERENGVPTLRAFFGRATLVNWHLIGRKADLVIALNVFAHVDDLVDVVEGVAALLADDGEFVIECGYLPDMLAHGVFSVIYHEHLSFWHIGPMFSFLMAHGLHLYDAERVPTQGGSMRYRASSRPRPQSDRLRAIIEETAVSYDTSSLQNRIWRSRVRAQGLLARARRAGLTVCGYGSPAQLTTIAHVCQMSHGDIKFVADDNPLKQGRYTSGTHWPIVPTSQLYLADICIIFSGNFADDIKARHADFEGEWVLL